MSCQTEFVDVHVLFLKYHGKWLLENPIVNFSEIWTAELKDLEKDARSQEFGEGAQGKFECMRYNWYNEMLKFQLEQNPGKKLRIVHWYVTSGNFKAFIINKEFFKEVAHIIGPQVEHWLFVNPGTNLRLSHGTKIRTTSFPIADIIDDFRKKEKMRKANQPCFSLMQFADAVGRMPFCSRDLCPECGTLREGAKKEKFIFNPRRNDDRCLCSIDAFMEIVKDERSAYEYYDVPVQKCTTFEQIPS